MVSPDCPVGRPDLDRLTRTSSGLPQSDGKPIVSRAGDLVFAYPDRMRAGPHKMCREGTRIRGRYPGSPDFRATPGCGRYVHDRKIRLRTEAVLSPSYQQPGEDAFEEPYYTVVVIPIRDRRKECESDSFSADDDASGRSSDRSCCPADPRRRSAQRRREPWGGLVGVNSIQSRFRPSPTNRRVRVGVPAVSPTGSFPSGGRTGPGGRRSWRASTPPFFPGSLPEWGPCWDGRKQYL